MGLLSQDQIREMGFAHVGSNARLSDRASFYNCAKITIADNVRIDDFCVLSAGEGGIVIESNVHIAVYSSLIGAGKIEIDKYCNISSRVSIYSSNDDYSGTTMTNPTIPDAFKNVTNADVTIGRHVIIGSGAIILPGVELQEGVAVGALSLIKSDCQSFGVYIGVPAKRTQERKRDLLEVERAFLEYQARGNQK
ncbi:acyltransferase [Pseudomonas fulva]|uniref:Hexapeptide repeat-containing transferase n=1 Tax=Pseudomonas fulva (strain 12-X) TaxID=743720 RepID=F6AKQ4_PSEF1|nr:acyltransferase [Pseudomonas fulva]AEF24128.1 hexapeptide repeat-containing transferase [Pseudomonas fulva 12-X]